MFEENAKLCHWQSGESHVSQKEILQWQAVLMLQNQKKKVHKWSWEKRNKLSENEVDIVECLSHSRG